MESNIPLCGVEYNIVLELHDPEMSAFYRSSAKLYFTVVECALHQIKNQHTPDIKNML